MPTIGATMTTQGGMQFSPAKLELCKASKFTLGGVALDSTSSVSDFKQGLEDMLVKCVEGCCNNPLKDSMLMRLIEFNTSLPDGLREINGFDPVLAIDTSKFAGSIQPAGATPLFKATYNLIHSIKEQGKILIGEGYNVNGIAFIITDGDNNSERQFTPAMIRELIESVRTEEALESLVTILIGINVDDPHMAASLDTFHREAGLTHFVKMNDVSAKGLAKLGGFISRSISSTSQAIATGGMSQSLAPSQTLVI
jgi:hypothetical protein